jgi:quercetin dioxygenase-like cupin family protein
MSNARFERLTSATFNVFEVTQLAPDTFLDKLMGADFVKIAPASSSQPHRHNHSDNLLYVISGRAMVLLNGVAYPLSPGLRVFIPRGMWHAFQTTDELLQFLSIQVPPILDKKRGWFDLEASGSSTPTDK